MGKGKGKKGKAKGKGKEGLIFFLSYVNFPQFFHTFPGSAQMKRIQLDPDPDPQ